MTMHIPTRPMDCRTDDDSPQPWMYTDLYRLQKLDRDWHNPATVCRAFGSKQQRQSIQGNSCDGCARIPEDMR